jgi:CelD/BcsL family acetyltransferase involved in cellulose biosynthesis
VSASAATDELSLSDLQLGTHDGEWGELAAEAGNIFGTPEWIATWWRHFGAGRQLLLTACRRSDGSLAGVLPLFLWTDRRPVRIVRFLGHGPGDALGPVCREADRPAVAAALRRRLRECEATLMVGENLPGEDGWSRLLGARVVDREASPVLALNGTSWDDLLGSWSRNLRSQVRSRERKLLGAHPVAYRLADDEERFERDLDWLFHLHRSRWPDGSGFSAAEDFHRDFAAKAFAAGWCRLWLLEIDGIPRAAWYGFRFAETEWYYQAGRDPHPVWEPFRLGFVLLAHSIREAAATGARQYRFLRGSEDFKYRFASHDHGLETVVRARNPGVRAAVGVALRLPRPLLRRLRRA